ncbi:MAG: hypothetical protein GX351_01760 [Peptococcaceae bacterium]|jgi:hypothetical protein|nr:hypothetical protein [Peptococcaceae bacterium]
MIVSAIKTIGIQCSNCGELQLKTLSIFELSHFNEKSICRCCGASLVTLTVNERGYYTIQYPCIYCGESHFMVVKKDLIWGEKPLQLICKTENTPIGYIGSKQFVENSCQEIMKRFIQLVSQLLNEEEPDAEFDNFFVVYAVMEMLGKMAQTGRLGCKCGNNNLAVEIMSDCIEIKCSACRASGLIYTDNKEILRIINNMGTIFLEEDTTVLISDHYETNVLVKNK